ncbi:molybdenum cofactor guanylyltransferase MobA [Serratia quinivorans]|uniref:molybdenum cofactor guanylyltransferase MobA n=1 Tax=Serratia quinivorans TaxID=137545 RepID=UPI002178B32E|nr:molybdenum cofactor guanylyltransferase MobA [Serratia quinivorans]CAI1198770.1 molybdopterin-guanine dinucleotide biosynthesis protein MobA [Serratia quinivorans]CAI1217258.1 molybdopterin-guanine dinucleotide biosynthesis protein MobA [Serratia quinivorans]CAI1939390.1 molybdopterin-guanine dinucleotide biosynthesis protein MobA [Serratia quinivorans]CAI2158042.1 molybdopterin-guanine dinucleotide biosynthesis protein MobA [Serratia quinivorans]CAI2158772.1 molybdopterin-guanine dinucleot
MHEEITGIILAGGRATRMGGEDKGLIQIAGIPLYQYVLSRLRPQVGQIAISANRNQARYGESGLPIVSDLTPDFSGPLAGMLAGLKHATTEWVVFVPCDVPDFPATLVDQLWQQKGNSLAAYASDGERAHPTLALLHTSLAPQLKEYLARGERKLMLFLDAAGARQIVFSDHQTAFHNLNTREDCLRWQQEKGLTNA